MPLIAGGIGVGTGVGTGVGVGIGVGEAVGGAVGVGVSDVAGAAAVLADDVDEPPHAANTRATVISSPPMTVERRPLFFAMVFVVIMVTVLFGTVGKAEWCTQFL
jgi:hypothetical protein